MESAQEIEDTCTCCGATPAPHEVAGGKDEGDAWCYCDDCFAERGRSRFGEQECSECGAVATTELEDEHGEMWPLCANCDVWWRETQAELADQADAIQGMCQDCRREPATCKFVHLHKGVFYLCDDCFGMADHEDDYLERCECAVPEGWVGDSTCFACRRPLPPATVYCTCAAPVVTRDIEQINCKSCHGRIRFGGPKPRPLCECPLPCTVDGDETYCFVCAGHIVKLTDEEVDAIRRREMS